MALHKPTKDFFDIYISFSSILYLVFPNVPPRTNFEMLEVKPYYRHQNPTKGGVGFSGIFRQQFPP